LLLSPGQPGGHPDRLGQKAVAPEGHFDAMLKLGGRAVFLFRKERSALFSGRPSEPAKRRAAADFLSDCPGATVRLLDFV
jgi:hypothetical protein